MITFDFRDDYNIYEEAEDSVGEVYVCPQVAVERSGEFGNDFDSELVLYVIHGMLHLFGYNDKTEEDQSDMTHAENRVMAWLREDDDLKEVFEYNG